MKTGHTWTQGGWHLGNRRKSRRDLDNHPFLQAAIPWEEGGKRRIAPAKCEGASGLFWERMCQVASTGGLWRFL
jgi:hypothetical protein